MSNGNIAQPDFELPCNVRSEQVVLGCLLENEQLLPAILGSGLEADDFSLSDHRRIFKAILDLRQQSAPVDYISVAEQLGNCATDFALLADLLHGVVVNASHALYHSKLVIKKASQRAVMKVCEETMTAAEEGTDPELLVSQAIGKLQAVGYER